MLCGVGWEKPLLGSLRSAAPPIQEDLEAHGYAVEATPKAA